MTSARDHVCELTVEEPDGRHGDREEGVRLHGDLDQGGREREEEEDGNQAEGHTETLPHPAETSASSSTTTRLLPHVNKAASTYH